MSGPLRIRSKSRARRSVCESLEERRLLAATVSLNLSTPLVSDGSGNSASFVISRTTTTGNLEVFYRVGGSAPASLFSQTFSGEAVIPAGQSSVTLAATPLTQAAGPDFSLTLALTTPENCGYTLGSVNQATMLAQNPKDNVKDVVVGPGQSYTTVGAAASAATAGEFIDVLTTGNYAGDTATVNVNNVTIRGIGNGRAAMVWNSAGGNYVPNEKGMIVQDTGGNNLTVENMELDGAQISDADGGNAAGIRAQGTNITVTNCRFFGNQMGFLGGEGNVLIQYSEFTGQTGEVNNLAHNVYINEATNTLTFQYNYSHDLGANDVGHLFKSRAQINRVLYNDFDDGTSEASLEVSFPNGGQDTVIGNVVVQTASSQNLGIIDFASEAAPYAGSFLYMAYNTVVNYADNANFVQLANLPVNFNFASEDNIFVGAGTVYHLTGSTTTPKVNAGNYVNSSVSGVDFVNAAAGDYHLLPNSPAINYGVAVASDPNGFSLQPVDEFVSPEAFRLRDASSDLDAGAFGSVTMQGRLVFYNGSSFDGNNTAANSADDGAIATDKTALLPGQTATFSNYTSYSNGLNGVMVDVKNLAYGSDLTAADFTFLVGNNSSPSGWSAAPAPVSFFVRPGAGTNGSTRVDITWANDAITNQWLQVMVLADGVTGLTTPDVFYFGNAIGETGNSSSNANVDALDVAATRNNLLPLGAASITNDYDFNRDGHVDALDVSVVRTHPSVLTPLVLISVPNVTSGATGVALLSAQTVSSAAAVPLLQTTATGRFIFSSSSPSSNTGLFASSNFNVRSVLKSLF